MKIIRIFLPNLYCHVRETLHRCCTEILLLLIVTFDHIGIYRQFIQWVGMSYTINVICRRYLALGLPRAAQEYPSSSGVQNECVAVT